MLPFLQYIAAFRITLIPSPFEVLAQGNFSSYLEMFVWATDKCVSNIHSPMSSVLVSTNSQRKYLRLLNSPLCLSPSCWLCLLFILL